MNSIERLAKLFSEFPGIGPRQARRLVYFLISRNSGLRGELVKTLTELGSDIISCDTCFRFFTKEKGNSPTCPICRDKNRDRGILMIVARDIDFESVEKTGLFKGFYFVLGGTVPILEKEPNKKIRESELKKVIEKHTVGESGLKEIILAMNVNAEGDNTARYLQGLLAPIAKKHKITLSTLGRGLSTGTELEYSDPDTLENALKNRH
ncbi:MAG: hypothetical protein A2653_02355 [Candidatus Zambryskibacteria bacterium RIFCSPHIGHO2_01_FULL_43_25]|uniref:Recombination protein RecR n=1 Tax=Candidatus Zambryskibacteria bacterium RIFCSPLOWO2_01_FULL_45_21 TaxID=1802761 RepID=A0A1G2U353_9BACT|nr:MAG: hypothetical protein A2653_02355 [Candidatus Zambryskibacteria bacterium RIFCSPHIGHO2_01_FULL_43_25]OHB01041.1 MAG: hypothetical protein A3E94_02535 [Candidatus Zambryskibacteria bacterium RIFCSPHIGHO2_12_FULL_44_12b]OHB03914.1 MAG: hypothetical protein A3B14_01095 [Candidatus Zambryskibacteria bacterium RIFCSPLOWO2_01_FULL_45_21]